MKNLFSDWYYKKPAFWIVVFIRFAILPIAIYKPVLGIILIILLDWADCNIWVHTLGMNKKEYYKVDKVIDYISYWFLVLISINQWTFPWYLGVLTYRMIGYCINLKTKNNLIHILFPNLIDHLFLYFNLLPILKIEKFSTSFWIGLLIVLIGKEFQEILLYKYKFSFYDLVFTDRYRKLIFE